MGTFASSDRTRRWTCSVRPARARETTRRLHQTCGPVNQCEHVCEKCPLTMRHTAKRSGELRRVVTTELRWECTPEAEAEHRAPSHPHSSPQLERTREGLRRRGGSTKLWKHGPPRTETGGEGEWCWSVQLTTDSMRRCVLRSSARVSMRRGTRASARERASSSSRQPRL